jgi:hypothetical protein
MNATLYEIKDDLDALAALLYEVGGDITEDEACAAIDAWLRETNEALRGKLDRYAALIREKESLAETRKEEGKRLLSLASSDEAMVTRLKARLQWFFEDQGIDKLETDRFRFTLANNGGKVPIQLLVPPDQLPEWARRVVVTPDMEAIRGEIEAAGSCEFASVGERGRHLRIR